MASKTLILTVALLAGCATTDEQTYQNAEKRVTNAAVVEGQARAQFDFPPLPPACTAKVERVKTRDEPWVVINYRWQVSADNRDRRADDCAKWGTDMRDKYGKAGGG
ncbi:hypothetical protein A6U87_16585 [Rhizobium sp. AC44/96]|uniref:hypothetical protein n=1 Tax=Rhizobium sp. AC44/96 TaxID=1841654 RepID=UPI000810102B|nr:hypothetical protein [Rhizobium sp. AC44/96]OCJ04448.1 hypothetical protein A6U87_16585 [Rhizobium sp. AC44/96]